MDSNLLVFGRENPPPAPIRLAAGPITLDFDPEGGGIRYLELPDGTEAVRAVYPSQRRADWTTVTPTLSDLQVDKREDGFKVSYRLDYELGGHRATVEIEGGPTEIVYRYEGVALETFRTNRTGLCVLHPVALADQPVEIRHPDGTRESGRFPDLVMPEWPFREVVGVSVKLPGYKVDVTMEGETFEMEDQRNFGDASFKTYCYPQSRPYPYEVAAGGRVSQTVRVTWKNWGSKVEGLDPMPDGVAGLIFLDETLPVPLIGLVADADVDPRAVAAAPCDYVRMPAEAAEGLGKPLELTLDLSDDAEGRIERALAHIATLEEPPERVIVSPVGAAKHVQALRNGMEDVLVLMGVPTLVDLNRSPIKAEDADGLSFGWHPQHHLYDDRTLFENVEAIPDLAATVAEKTEGPIVVGPLHLANWEDPRADSLLFAAWLVSALSSVMQSDVDATTLFNLEGANGLFHDGRVNPAYHVLYDLYEFADGDLIIGVGTARRAAGFALVMEEEFRAVVANLTPEPLTLSVVAAGDGAHKVKVLDGRNVQRAMEEPMAWREEEGEAVLPSEGVVEIELGPYGVARIDAEVEALDEEE